MDLNFQYAHNTHDESETVKDVSTQDALDAFDSFDWIGEANKAIKLQKCAPTLAIIKNGREHMIWVSSCEEDGEVTFVSECLFPGEVSRWFGLSKKQGVVSLHENYFSYDQTRKAITLFLDEDYEGLRALYRNA